MHTDCSAWSRANAQPVRRQRHNEAQARTSATTRQRGLPNLVGKHTVHAARSGLSVVLCLIFANGCCCDAEAVDARCKEGNGERSPRLAAAEAQRCHLVQLVAGLAQQAALVVQLCHLCKHRNLVHNSQCWVSMRHWRGALSSACLLATFDLATSTFTEAAASSAL